MMGNSFCHDDSDSDSSEGEVFDRDADRLSNIGTAAYEVLSKQHKRYWKQLWNVTSGSVLGNLHQTPFDAWTTNGDLPDGHDDWFPQKMCDILSRTEHWCDVCSLGPPDGLFMEKFKEGLANIARHAAQRDTEEDDDPIIIRMMFGNIVGMPVNCNAVIEALTEDLDEDSGIQLWVGSWRTGVSWNHAKIIAVDGRYLHTGGHNLWDRHYLKVNPVHDLSLELEGCVAKDGHRFANAQWQFIEDEQSGIMGTILASSLPDSWPTVLPTRVTVSEWPEEVAEEFPPQYRNNSAPKVTEEDHHVPILTMGRYGALLRRSRPSDDAIVAMFDAAEEIIHLALQDLGPITLPGVPGPAAVPGCVWPEAYLKALGRAIWEREVDVEIIVSNPGSIPDNLTPMDALYGNGWTCSMVASEIIKTIQTHYHADDDELREKVQDNLRVCYLKQAQGKAWDDGKTMGMHAKHFIIDDKAYYVGSQNLYVADLAEWGVFVDDEATTQRAMQDYWNPMWQASYREDEPDCDVDEVMDGLHIDRNGSSKWMPQSHETKELIRQAQHRSANVPVGSSLYGDQ